MSGEKKKSEDTKENGSTTESDSEMENSSYIVEVESESSTELVLAVKMRKADAKDVVTVRVLPPEKSESSDTETTNSGFEFPDDSEFCQSIESFSKLRKRPSDTSIENTSKKPCNEISGSQKVPTADKEIIEVGRVKDESSESTSDMMDQAVNDPFELSPISLGLRKNRESEIEKSEDTGTSHSPGRFTKHKGDTKCQHGTLYNSVATSCSEGDDADVEDNVESSVKSSESSESDPKETQTPTAETQLQSTLKDMVKRHIKPSSDNKKSTDSVTKPTSGNKKPKNTSSKDPTTTKSSHQAITHKTKIAASTKTKPKPDASSNSEAKNPKKSDNSNETLGENASKSETSSSESNSPNDKSQMTRQKTKRRRCGVCNKKLSLTATPCRCEGIFCAIHRYDREHNCTFDYRAMGAEEIRKNNPQVKGEKIRKI